MIITDIVDGVYPHVEGHMDIVPNIKVYDYTTDQGNCARGYSFTAGYSIIPDFTAASATIHFNRAEFERVLAAIVPLAKADQKDFYPLTIKWSGNLLQFTTASGTVDYAPTVVNGSTEFKVNAKFLHETVKYSEADSMELYVCGPNIPLVFTSGNPTKQNPFTLTILMPMHLRS
jgi:DNA polymerase III sliding clamp (beta) subunit (PCNA family)